MDARPNSATLSRSAHQAAPAYLGYLLVEPSGRLEKDFVSWAHACETWEIVMELRIYFVAVADAGSLAIAAEQKLHTSLPSLSLQIRDLEQEIGVQLMNRSATALNSRLPAMRFSNTHDGAASSRGSKGSSAARSSAGETDIRRWLSVGG
jgi:hypothetical protein